MSKGSLTVQPGENPMQREYLLGVGFVDVGVDEVIGEILLGGGV